MAGAASAAMLVRYRRSPNQSAKYWTTFITTRIRKVRQSLNYGNTPRAREPRKSRLCLRSQRGAGDAGCARQGHAFLDADAGHAEHLSLDLDGDVVDAAPHAGVGAGRVRAAEAARAHATQAPAARRRRRHAAHRRDAREAAIRRAGQRTRRIPLALVQLPVRVAVLRSRGGPVRLQRCRQLLLRARVVARVLLLMFFGPAPTLVLRIVVAERESNVFFHSCCIHAPRYSCQQRQYNGDPDAAPCHDTDVLHPT